eukprot:5230205-Prymnesium_polylepis.1
MVVLCSFERKGCHSTVTANFSPRQSAGGGSVGMSPLSHGHHSLPLPLSLSVHLFSDLLVTSSRLACVDELGLAMHQVEAFAE